MKNQFIVAIDARPLSAKLSGVSRVISQVIKNFPDQNRYEFKLFSNRSYHSDFADIVDLPNVQWIQSSGMLSKFGAVWYNLAHPFELRRISFDLYWGSQQVIPPFLSKKVPVVLTFYDLVSQLYPQAMRYLHRLQIYYLSKMSVKRADRILSISAQTQNDMIRYFHYPKEKARVALLGYEPPALIKKSKISKKLASLQKTPFILSVSTIEPRKNFRTLIDAWYEYFQNSNNPYHLVVAGKRGWETESFFDRIDQISETTGALHIIEGTSDNELRLLYQNCAFFALASHYEGFGLPLLEAMWEGKNAIVSDIGSFHEIGGKQIQYIPADDKDAWVDAIEQMVQKHKKGNLKPAKLKKSDWTWKNAATIHKQAFDEVLAVQSTMTRD